MGAGTGCPAVVRGYGGRGSLQRGADDQGDDPLLAVGTWNLFADLAPAAHDDGSVGDLGDVIEGVRDDDHGVTFVTQAKNEVENTTRLAQTREPPWARRG